MKRRRALLLSLTVVLALCAACGWWLHVQKQQYAHNRQLIAALKKSDFHAALALVNAGADPNTRVFPTPAPTLSQLLKHLLHHSPPPANNSRTALMLACNVDARTQVFTSGNADSAESQLALLRAMLSHGANVNARYSGRGTALEPAVAVQNPRLVELLLQHGADANIPDDMGRTPLIVATWSDSTQEVRLLLAHGANPNVQYENGETALSYAVSWSNAKDLIPDLLAHGANPNLYDRNGFPPLEMAQMRNRPDLVRLLKQHGAK